MKYLTNRQVVFAAAQLYRRYVGAYYRKVKTPETPTWKWVAEMWESITELPEGARLKIWREKRGVGRKKLPMPVNPARVREQQVPQGVTTGRRRFTPRPGGGTDMTWEAVPATTATVPMQTGTTNQLFHWDPR